MYNGYKSWNQWNVSLWINNDEGLYFFCRHLVKKLGKERAVTMIHAHLCEQTTPDGAHYNRTSIAAALTDILN